MSNKIFSLIFVAQFFFSCLATNHKQKKIIGLELSYSIPIYKVNTTELVQLNDTLLLYFNEDIILIRELYKSTSYNDKAIKNGEFIITDDKETILNTEIKMRDYVFTKNSTNGLRYESVNSKQHNLFNVDSLLRKKTFKGAKFFDKVNDSLIEQKKDQKTGLVYEKYIPKIIFDESYNDTTYCVFDPKFKAVDFSLSKEADSLRKMKLVEVRLSYNAKPKTVDNLVAIPQREFSFKIKELKINNQEEIIMLFNRFRKDNEKLNLK